MYIYIYILNNTFKYLLNQNVQNINLNFYLIVIFKLIFFYKILIKYLTQTLYKFQTLIKKLFHLVV